MTLPASSRPAGIMAAHQMFVHQFLLYPHFLVVKTSTIVIGTLVLYIGQKKQGEERWKKTGNG